MKLFKKAKKGFTLVELIVVIAIVAILAAVSVAGYYGFINSAKQSRVDQEASQAKLVLQAAFTPAGEVVEVVTPDDPTTTDLDETVTVTYEFAWGSTGIKELSDRTIDAAKVHSLFTQVLVDKGGFDSSKFTLTEAGVSSELVTSVKYTVTESGFYKVINFAA